VVLYLPGGTMGNHLLVSPPSPTPPSEPLLSLKRSSKEKRVQKKQDWQDWKLDINKVRYNQISNEKQKPKVLDQNFKNHTWRLKTIRIKKVNSVQVVLWNFPPYILTFFVLTLGSSLLPGTLITVTKF